MDASGRAIKSAGEATIVGSTVFLRGDIEYYAFDDPILERGRMETEEQRAKRVKRGPKYDRAISRFEAFSKRNGVEFQNRQDLEAAYDNMPIESRVALNESEVAENMLRADEMASSRLQLRRTAGRGPDDSPRSENRFWKTQETTSLLRFLKTLKLISKT